jgi:hypothetical protein
MLDVGMGPQDLLLYDKRIVIWFGDGIQWVNWLGNPLLYADPFRGKGYFWEEKQEGKKG